MRFTSAMALAAAALVAGCGGAPRQQADGWADYRLAAARQIVQANAADTFSGELPDPLKSIPVLQVQLDRDGGVRNIVVLRRPQAHPETVEMASRAIRRAAPFGPVAHLPQPWQFSETFLYNDEFKFQLRTLVEAP